jgi:hypothetical protein
MPLARRRDRVAQLRATHLGPPELRGHVGVVYFWTLTCINWLRQEPYVRAWPDADLDAWWLVSRKVERQTSGMDDQQS